MTGWHAAVSFPPGIVVCNGIVLWIWMIAGGRIVAMFSRVLDLLDQVKTVLTASRAVKR